MKIAFAYPAFENLGMEYISALLKEHGHETFLLFDPQLFNDLFINMKFISNVFDYQNKLKKEVLKKKPDIIAFSVVSDNFTWACKYAKMYKKLLPGIPIVFGGPHATAVPKYILKNWFVDFAIVGEGELPMLELVEALENKTDYTNIQNLGYKDNDDIIINETRPLLQDLDLLPYPDKELFLNANPYAKKEYNLITARGCVHKCSYCHNSLERKVLWKKCGNYLRRRSIDNILTELKESKEKYHFNTLCIWDEVFTYDEEWLEEFCHRYKNEIGVPFWTFIHPNHVTKRVVELLEYAGCWEAEMGVQTLNQEVKDNILHRYEKKETVVNAIKLFEHSKIRLVVDVIFGLPLLKEEDYIELIETFNENRPAKIQTFWLRYYPKIDIIDIAKDNEWLTNEDIEEINQGIPSRAAASGGTKIDAKFEKYQIILTLLPFCSKKTINTLLLKKDNLKLPAVSKYGHLFTRLFDLKNKHDVGGRRYTGRMLYFIPRKIFN
ncbi:MAG: Radical domain protein [Herbinix sp.]|jgi:radical SAM superfamily enzyme YgiQ (UPF0313 family)|nr:Radical domain protein [Herbinix sp.]